jgi:hypothetical protein
MKIKINLDKILETFLIVKWKSFNINKNLKLFRQKNKKRNLLFLMQNKWNNILNKCIKQKSKSNNKNSK